MDNIQGGYYIKARCIQESEISKAPPHVREIWDWLLMQANHSDSKVCKRGQCIRSYKDIQEGLSWYVGFRKETYKKHHCEKAMKWLKKADMIATEKTTRGIIITVINYDTYQNPKNYESYIKTTPLVAMELQGEATINKNDKEEKNFNIGSDEPKKPKGTGKRKKIKYSEEFEIFWKQWYSIADRPTESKKSAFNEFKKLDIEEHRLAYKNIKPYSESLDDKKYMKHCCRYLKLGIFSNEFTKKPSTQGSRANTHGCSDFDLKEMFG